MGQGPQDPCPITLTGETMEERILVFVEDEDPVEPTRSGYKAGELLRSRNGVVYQAEETGSFRRQTPKPLSKKERAKARKEGRR